VYTIKLLFALVILALIGIGGYIWSGVYTIGADVPHWPATAQVLQMLRTRAVEQQARDIPVPKLDDPKMIAEGAEHYAAMCSGCHLAPGKQDSEIRPGLYPQPPKLAEKQSLTAAQSFWVIKHGIKLSAMPAWGTTHNDDAIWNIVAFLQKLPGMTPEEYQKLSGASSGEEQHEHHHDDATEDHSHDNPD
jgi:mono/diheme cytochrome c family protein